MWALVENNEVKQIFKRPVGFKSNGLTYSSDVFKKWNAQELLSVGILPYIDIKPDERFYEYTDSGYDVSNEVIKNYTLTEKSLSDLKLTWIDYVKDRAKNILFNTDWMVLRFVETATPIPTAVQTRRNNIRQRSIALIKAINDCTTIEEFKALFESVDGSNPQIEDWPEG